MKIINARNVHQALPLALDALQFHGVRRESRNGPVTMFPEPVTTVYAKPTERVIFWPERDANPFFHLVESLWMLDGRNDVETVAQYVGRMRSFSDDGVTFHGAYGYRWRNHFDFDQLKTIIAALQANPDDRRQVLSMWDARADLGRQGKDLPCNLQALFQITHGGALDMMVTNRSNDMVWGAYGANAVHFSYLHEFMASAIGVPVGVYRQVSANFHAYDETWKQVEALADYVDPYAAKIPDPYASGDVEPYPLMTVPWQQWLQELNLFLSEGPVMGLRDPFLRKVAWPMIDAYSHYKNGKGADRFNRPIDILMERCAASDWRLAGVQWLERRRERAETAMRRERAKDDGPLPLGG